MIEIINATDATFHVDFEAISKWLGLKGHLELNLVDAATMQKINQQTRNTDQTTDVLSFPYAPMPNAPLGSIVINVCLARQTSSALGHGVHEEIMLLFIHALLHILGFDHEMDHGQMRAKEHQAIEHFHLPKSLIARNEDDGD